SAAWPARPLFASRSTAGAVLLRSSAGTSANASAISRRRRTARSGWWKTPSPAACSASRRNDSADQPPFWVRGSVRFDGGHRRDDSRSREGICGERAAKAFLKRASRPLSGEVEIHGDKLDGPSAFFAQRGGRVHRCDAQRLVMAVRLDDEQTAHHFLRLGVRPIADMRLAAARAKRPPAVQIAKRRGDQNLAGSA